MALTATRLEFKIELIHVDRNVERSESLIVAQHPSETTEHVILRVLSWCLLWEEHLMFGPGLSTRDAADLWAHSLTGELTTWIDCGSSKPDEIRRVMQQNPDVRAHAVFDSSSRYEAFVREIEGWAKFPKHGSLHAWQIDSRLVRSLAERCQRRQKWSITISGNHFYADTDGVSLDGAVEQERAFGSD